MNLAPPAKLKIDVLIDSDLWQEPTKMRSTVRRAIAQAAATTSTTGMELAIVLTDDSAIRQLNRLWRGIDAPTNVLSFPSKRATDDPPHLGDVVLAYEAVHGFLHLVGHDHERDADAEAMERAERDILCRLGIPDPYRHAGHSSKAVKSARNKR